MCGAVGGATGGGSPVQQVPVKTDVAGATGSPAQKTDVAGQTGPPADAKTGVAGLTGGGAAPAGDIASVLKSLVEAITKLVASLGQTSGGGAGGPGQVPDQTPDQMPDMKGCPDMKGGGPVPLPPGGVTPPAANQVSPTTPVSGATATPAAATHAH